MVGIGLFGGGALEDFADAALQDFDLGLAPHAPIFQAVEELLLQLHAVPVFPIDIEADITVSDRFLEKAVQLLQGILEVLSWRSG